MELLKDVSYLTFPFPLFQRIRQGRRDEEMLKVVLRAADPEARHLDPLYIRIQSSKSSYMRLLAELHRKMQAERSHRATIDAKEEPVKFIQSEIYSSYLDTFYRLMSTFSRTMHYKDMVTLTIQYYGRLTEDFNYNQYMEHIFRRIVHKIRQKEEDFSTEAQYWMHFKYGRQWMPPTLHADVRNQLWGQVRREADQGSRPWNTYHDNLY